MNKKAFKGCEVLLFTCAEAKLDEKILIITDDNMKEIGETMYAYASQYFDATLICTKSRETHGAAPTECVTAAMADSDVIFAATTFSLYNTPARLKACKAGSRFVNMADYSIKMLEEGCLFVDFADTRRLVNDIASKILGKTCVITTSAGTNFTANIEGKKAVSGYGIANKPGMSSSPPDIETAVGPNDNTAEGILVIDGSIPLPGLGPIKEPIVLTVHNGYITEIEGGDEAKLFRNFLVNLNDPRVYLIGEIGFGMNRSASISGRMLEDEGVFGTIHIGIGNNLSYGGTNATPIHIDLIMRNPTYAVDEEIIYSNGTIVNNH